MDGKKGRDKASPIVKPAPAVRPSASTISNKGVRVTVTGACERSASILSMMVARGELFGPKTRVDMTLVESKTNINKLTKGTAVELEMCNLPLLGGLRTTCSMPEAFKDAQYIFLACGIPHNPAFSRNDMIGSNALEFKEVGIALQAVENKTAKILVISEPQNMNMVVLRHFAPYLDPKQITGLSRVEHNRVVAKFSKMLNISPSKLTQLGVWGNIGINSFPDLRHALVEVNGKVMDAYHAFGDEYYLKFDFVAEIQARPNEIYKKRLSVPCLTVANAAIQHMKVWLEGTPEGDWTSMVVFSDGSYDVDKGIPYSYPIRVDKKGVWHIVEDLDINFFEKEQLMASAENINKEKHFVLSILDLTDKETNEERVPVSWSFGSAEPVACRILGEAERQRMGYF